MSLVEEAISTWEMFRKGTLAELENIPEEHWDYRPDPGARTLREVASHIAELWVAFVGEILRPDGSFMRVMNEQERAQHMAGYPKAHSKAEILDLLRATGEKEARRLREAGDALATQTMQTQGGDQSRLKALWFAIAHEMYHRGQITVYARALGLVPAMTQQMAARMAGKAG